MLLDIRKARIALTRFVKNLSEGLLESTGLTLVSSKRWTTTNAQRDRLLEELLSLDLAGSAGADLSSISGIVFSKDRPLQLDGLLNSYFAHVLNPAPLTVLYAASTQAFAAAYEEAASAQAGRRVRFIQETRFRDDLLKVLSETTAARVFFLVDDIVFIRPIDLSDLAAIDPRKQIVSMRMGLNLNHCYTIDARQELPPHRELSSDLIAWTWRDGALDWAYPASVDGNIFLTSEVQTIARVSDFKAPNTFEVALSTFSSLWEGREGVCYKSSRLVNIPANKVQSEYDNLATEVAPSWLLEQWQTGRRLDWRRLENFANVSAHQEITLPMA